MSDVGPLVVPSLPHLAGQHTAAGGQHEDEAGDLSLLPHKDSAVVGDHVSMSGNNPG